MDFVHHVTYIKNTKALTFQKPALLPSSGKELIICWAPQIKLFSVTGYHL